jgi:dihydrofolate reductase
MGKVVVSLTMSLDGFIANRDDSVDPIFDWYDAGDVEIKWPGNDMVSRVAPPSAAYLHDVLASAGALVVGRRVFDITNGWGGSHPVGVPVFVVTHTMPSGWPRADAPFTFVHDGVETAIRLAQEVAGEKDIAMSGPNVAQQALNAGLLDEIRVEIAPVLLGTGIRFFDGIDKAPVLLDDPVVIESTRVTHLIYRVRRGR